MGWQESLADKDWEMMTWFRVTCWRNLADALNQYLERIRTTKAQSVDQSLLKRSPVDEG